MKKYKLSLFILFLTLSRSYLFGAPITNFKDLQSAMTTATEGDTIEIGANFDITGYLATSNSGTSSKHIIISGNGHTLTGAIKAGDGAMFNITKDYWTISDLTITNGTGGDGTSPSPNGTTGGIIISGSNATLSYVTISNCNANGWSNTTGSLVNAGNGGVAALNITGASAVLENITIADCDADGGIIGDNSAGLPGNGGYGAIYLYSSGCGLNTVKITGCRAIGGSCPSEDGGHGGTLLYFNGQYNNLENFTITSKNTVQGGAQTTYLKYIGGVGGNLLSIPGSHNTLNHFTIENNFANGGDAIATNSKAHGGNLISLSGSNNKLENFSSISSNNVNGGASKEENGGKGGNIISISGSNNTLKTFSSMDSNSANQGSTSIGTANSYGGNLIYITSTAQVTSLQDFTISSNYVNGSSIATDGYGGNGGNLIYVEGATSTLNNITLSQNEAKGGAGYSYPDGNGGYGILINGSKNLVSSCSITGNNFSGGSNGSIIEVNTGTKNSILENIISGNQDYSNVISLVNGGNNSQGNVYDLTCMVCPIEGSSSYNLTVKGTAPIAASGGTGTLLLQAFFNTTADPEMNSYVGSTTIKASSPTVPETFEATFDNVDYSNFTTVSFTVTNSNGDHSYDGFSNLGDTSELSEETIPHVS